MQRQPVYSGDLKHGNLEGIKGHASAQTLKL